MNPGNNIAYLFVILAKWRRILAVNFLISAALGVTISLVLPKWYKANTSIVPSMRYSQGMDIAALLNPFSAGGLDLSSAGSEMITFVGILKSRSVRETAIEEFGLIEYWKSKNMDDALETMTSRMKIDINDEGFIVIEVEEKNAGMAANLANYMVQKLDSINIVMNVQAARANREFLDERVKEIHTRLQVIEDSLRIFQEENKAYSIPEQTMAMITAAADIQAQIYTLEVEIKVLENSVNRDHPMLQNSRLQLRELKKKLHSMEKSGGSEDLAQFQIPFEDIPQIGMQYFRFYREAEKFKRILEILIPQLENAKFEEVKNTPTIQVLDQARPAQMKSKPVRSKLTILITLMGMFITGAYIIVAERWAYLRQSDEQTFNQIQNSLSAIIKDCLFWKKG